MARISERRTARRSGAVGQRPWHLLRNPYPPLRIVSDDELESIHHVSLEILESLGLEILDDVALDLMAREGQTVDRANGRVRFDRHWIEQRIATAPAETILSARNPERSITLGSNHIVFHTVGGAPNCHDAIRGRRAGNARDLDDLIRLAQSINALHSVSSLMLAAQDLDARTRHLDAYFSVATLTDKVWGASLLGADRALDAIHMSALAMGVTPDEMASRPSVFGNINTNSPLRVDGPMIRGLTVMAEHGQPVTVTPFTLAGAMSPVTLAGALAQQNAEALAMIAYAQTIRPGTPVVYGAFTSNVDMKSGAPAFGTPEYAKATLVGGQLARRYGLPYRTSNCNAANVVDAQAAYESQMSLWPAVLGFGNLVYHAAGWMEGGLIASFEKMILDAEMLQMMAEFLRPIRFEREDFALDALAEVGPGGHFFGAQHTIARYESAFYAPMLSDWRNYPAWEAAGALTATQRATAIWQSMLASYEEPPMDKARREALAAYVAKRKEDVAATPG